MQQVQDRVTGVRGISRWGINIHTACCADSFGLVLDQFEAAVRNFGSMLTDVSGWFGEVLSIGGTKFQRLGEPGPSWRLGAEGRWCRHADDGQHNQQQGE
jgi:hypothetical protein